MPISRQIEELTTQNVMLFPGKYAMTGAYATFADGGVHTEPTPFLKITDSQGRVVHELGQPKGTQALPPGAKLGRSGGFPVN